VLRDADPDRADQVLRRLPRPDPERVVVELIGPDGTPDHVVCLSLVCREDDGTDTDQPDRWPSSTQAKQDPL